MVDAVEFEITTNPEKESSLIKRCLVLTRARANDRDNRREFKRGKERIGGYRRGNRLIENQIILSLRRRTIRHVSLISCFTREFIYFFIITDTR